MKKHIFRIGIKNFPAAHGGVETCTQYFVENALDRYDFTIFTCWENAPLPEKFAKVRVFQLEPGWFARFRQIRAAVKDKKNTILDFQMVIFIPLAIVFSLLGYNVVSSVHGRSWWNVKISMPVRWLICIVDILGVNLVRRTIYVSKWDYEAMRKYTFRKYYLIPNGSALCEKINDKPTKDMVFIGRISIQKNLANLIVAVERDGRELDIYGPYDERECENTAKIKRLIEDAKHVHYCGVLRPEEIYETFGNYRCAVNPSKSEASPNAVIEAGACGLFLYLSDIPGHRGVGYPDVFYFDKEDIRLPILDGIFRRSVGNIDHHRKNLSIVRQIDSYAEVYESFR